MPILDIIFKHISQHTKLILWVPTYLSRSDPLDSIFDRIIELCSKNGISTDLHNRIRLFIFYWYYLLLPKQRSEEWKQARKHVIGGSEITDLIKAGPEKMVKRKQNPFTGSTATRWGVLFEIVAGMLITKISGKMPMINTGSIPGIMHNGKHVMAYSPDLLVVMTHNQLLTLLTHPKNNCMGLNKQLIIDKFLNNLPMKDSYIVLMEFKCPYSRQIGAVIPDTYKHQPNSGTMCIPICDFYLYLECQIENSDDLDSALLYGNVTFKNLKYAVDDANIAEFLRNVDRKEPIYSDTQEKLGLNWALRRFNLVPGLPDKSLYDLYKRVCIDFHELSIKE